MQGAGVRGVPTDPTRPDVPPRRSRTRTVLCEEALSAPGCRNATEVALHRFTSVPGLQMAS